VSRSPSRAGSGWAECLGGRSPQRDRTGWTSPGEWRAEAAIFGRSRKEIKVIDRMKTMRLPGGIAKWRLEPATPSDKASPAWLIANQSSPARSRRHWP
jgi:hypothetical protein